MKYSDNYLNGRSRNNRGRSMSGSYTYVGKHPAQNERFGVYGIFKRKKRIIDIPEVGKYEICIPKPRILVQGILRRYHGEKYKSNKDVHIRTIEEG